jgi:hypothetical protein
VEKEQEEWYKERKAGVDEIITLRAKADEEESKIRSEKEKDDGEERMDVEDEVEDSEVKNEEAKKEKEAGREPSPAPFTKGQAMDEDDAVEY